MGELTKRSNEKYARLIGYTEDSKEMDFIQATIDKSPNIEWFDKENGIYHIYLTKEQYNQQMMLPDRTWCDPNTGLGEDFDEEYFESEHISE